MTLESQGDTKISLSMIRLPSFNSLVKNSFKVEKSSNGFFISDKFAPTAQENDLSIEGLHPFGISTREAWPYSLEACLVNDNFVYVTFHLRVVSDFLT